MRESSCTLWGRSGAMNRPGESCRLYSLRGWSHDKSQHPVEVRGRARGPCSIIRTSTGRSERPMHRAARSADLRHPTVKGPIA